MGQALREQRRKDRLGPCPPRTQNLASKEMLKIKVKGIVTGNGTGCSPGRGRGSLGKDFLKRDVPPSSHKMVGGWPSHAPVQTPWPSGRGPAL